MSDKNTSYKVKIQAVLDKIKALANLKSTVKALASKVTIKMKGTLDSTVTKKEFDKNLKKFVPKIKFEADFTKILQKVKSLGKQKADITIHPTLDDSQVMSALEEMQKRVKTLSGISIQIDSNASGSENKPTVSSKSSTSKGSDTAKVTSSSTESAEVLHSGIKEATIDIITFLDQMGVLEGSMSTLDKLKNKDFESFVKGMIQATESMSQLTTAMSLVDGEMSAEKLEAIGKACIGLSDNQLKLILSMQGIRNEEREAILVGMGMEEEQRQQTLATLGFANAENVATASAFSFKKALNSLKAAWASNPIGIIVTAITTAVSLATTAISYFQKQREEEAQALKDAISDYGSAMTELKDINAALEENKKKIDELTLKDKLTYVEKGQLKELQEVTKELQVQADLEERKAARAAKEMARGTINEYKEEYGDYDISEEAIKEHLQYDATGADVEIANENDISRNLAYLAQFEKKLAETRDKLINPDEYDLLPHDISWLDEDYENYSDQIDKLADRLDLVYSDLLERQQNLEPEYTAAIANQANGEMLTVLEREAIQSYESLNESLDLMYKYLYRDNWNDMEISNIFLTENVEKARDDILEMAKAGQLTAETIEKEFPKLFHAIQNSEIFPEEGKSAAEVFCERMEEEAKNWTKYVPRSFEEVFHSVEFSSGKEKLMELAKAGELTPSVLSGTEDYAVLLTETSLSAEEATGKIMAMLSAQEKLAAASKGIDKLQASYDEFQKIGSVTAATLEELPDVIKNLDGFDSFTKIVSDPSQGTEKIQKEYNVLVNEYLSQQGTLDTLVGASEEEIQAYIANIKQMGSVNAEEMVQVMLYASEQADLLLDEAEAEYRDYLESRNGVDEEYLKSVDSKNSQLAALLGTPYQTDYENWCELLSKKTEAYNEFVKRIGESYDPSLSAAENLMANGKAVNTFNLQEYYTAQTAIANATREEEQKREILKPAVMEVNSNYKALYKPSSSAGSKSSSAADSSQEKEPAVETFNFLETLLDRLSKAFDKLKAAGENTFKTLAARAGNYENALGVVEQQMNTQQQAYNTYMEKASAVGLDEYWASQVRDGSLHIVDITDDGLKEQIKAYQEWYEKALACSDALEELNRQQTELVQAKIELLVTEYDNLIEKLSGKNDRIQGRIELKEAWGFSAGKVNYKNMNKNLQDQIDYTKRQNEALKNLLGTVDEGSEAWYEYNQRIDTNNASIQELTKSMAENAKAAAALAGEKAAAKVEKQDSKMELYDAKADNATTAKKKNKQVDKKISAIDKQQEAYDDAVDKDKKNLNQAKKTVNKFKSTKENKSLLKSVKSYTKSGKKIPKKLLDEAAKLSDNGAFYNACVQYNAYLESYHSDKEAAELFAQISNQKKADLALEKFDNISTEYDNQIAADEQKKTSLQNQISLAEVQGKKPSTSYYKDLLGIETEQQEKLVKKREVLQQSLNEAVADGTVLRGSDEWYRMVDEINSVINAIEESKLSVAEYKNQIREIWWDAFDKGMESVKRLNSEIDYYQSMLENEKMTDEDGNFTEYGRASLALHNTNYESYMAQAKEYAREYQELLKTADLSDERDIERIRQLEDAQRHACLSAKNEKQAIVELIREGYDAQLDSLSELIQKYKDLKRNEKDTYDYHKTIAEKTKNIAALQKQLRAYDGNDTEEAKAKIQKLKVELEEVQQDLEETEYDKYLSDMDDMLDELYGEYESFIDEKLNQTNTILEGIGGLIGDTNSVLGTLNELVAGIGSGGTVSAPLANAVTGQTSAAEYINATVGGETAAAESNVSTPPVTAETQANTASGASSAYPVISHQYDNAQVREEASADAYKKQLIKEVKKYIKNNATNATKVKEKYSPLNQVLYDNKGALYKGTGKVLEDVEKLKGLAKVLGVDYDNAQTGGTIYKKLKSLKIQGFANGSKYIEKDQIAMTQEKGRELIYNASKGAMLTPLGKGDMVFTDEMSKNLWDISRIPMEQMIKSVNITPVFPDIPASVYAPVTHQNVGGIHINLGGITMNGVNDPVSFAEELNRQLSSNPQTIGILQTQSVEIMNGHHNSFHAVKCL